MIDCANGDIRDRLPELVNGRLEGELLDVVQAHVADCRPCQAEVRLLERARAVLHSASPRVDTAAVVRALPAPASRSHRRSFDWRIAAAIAVLTVGGGSTVVMYHGWSSTRKVDSIAQAVDGALAPAERGAPRGDGSELTVSSDLSGLTDDQLRSLLGKVDGIEALPAAEVHVGVPTDGEVAPEGATGGGRSGAL
jgi:hypothetical protein